MIKKWALLLAAVMLLASATPALALTDDTDPETGVWTHSVDEMAKYRSQWKKLNELEQEHLKLRIEALKKQNETADLYAKMDQSKKAKHWREAAEYKEQMRSVHDQMKETRKQMAAQRKEAAEAIKSGDEKKAKQALDKWIDLKKEHNKLYKQKLGLWDKMLKKVK